MDETPGGVHLINLLPISYPTQVGGASGWVNATIATDGVRLDVSCVNKEDPLHRSIHELKRSAG